MKWQTAVTAAGGVATRRDLLALGLDDELIRIFVRHGLLERVRRGRYVLPETDSLVRTAVRAGGRLACVSALAHRGVPGPDDGRVHVEVPANANIRLSDAELRRVRLHWARHPSAGDRAAVDVEPALRQALACGG